MLEVSNFFCFFLNVWVVIVIIGVFIFNGDLWIFWVVCSLFMFGICMFMRIKLNFWVWYWLMVFCLLIVVVSLIGEWLSYVCSSLRFIFMLLIVRILVFGSVFIFFCIVFLVGVVWWCIRLFNLVSVIGICVCEWKCCDRFGYWVKGLGLEY